MDIETAKADYRSRYELGDDVSLVVFQGPDDSIIVGHYLADDKCHPSAWTRFYISGKVENGTLWGGDVWDPR